MRYVSVLTSPKRPQYLESTIAALEAAGGFAHEHKFIWCDGDPYFMPRDGWAVYSTPGIRPLGVRGAMREVFRMALSHAQCSQLLYLEDDAIPASNALLKLPGIRDDQAMVSLFDNHEFPGAARAKPGVQDVPLSGRDGLGLFGACALLLPRTTIEWAMGHWDEWPGDPDAADQALSYVLRDGPWTVRGVSIPSLFEHVGDISSMGHNAGRAALFSIGGMR